MNRLVGDKTDYFFYECIFCGCSITIEDLNLYYLKIKNSLLEEFTKIYSDPYEIASPTFNPLLNSSLEEEPLHSPGGGIINTDISKIFLRKGCKHNHQLKIFLRIVISFDQYSLMENFFLPMSSETLWMKTNPMILHGSEITELLSYLFKRWSRLQNSEIIIFSPFVDEILLDNLFEIIKDSLMFGLQAKIKISIYTRKIQKFGRATLRKMILEWFQKKMQKETSHYGQYNELWIKHNYLILQTFSLFKFYYTPNNFHLKMYFCKDFNELCFSSFNFVSHELHQLESFIVAPYSEMSLSKLINLKWYLIDIKKILENTLKINILEKSAFQYSLEYRMASEKKRHDMLIKEIELNEQLISSMKKFTETIEKMSKNIQNSRDTNNDNKQ
jgi:hypothetical protein